MATGLSLLTSLKTLVLEFRFPRSRDDRETRHVPPITRAVVPSLTTTKFEGESEYLEDLLSRIDAPLLDCIKITFFNQVMFDTPLLGHFISRTETFTAVHRAEVIFRTLGVQIILVRQNGMFNNETLTLLILCKPSDWQLSSIAQVCNSIIPPLPTLGKLSIDEGPVQRLQWYGDMENTQWLELFQSFTRVKNLVLSRLLVRPMCLHAMGILDATELSNSFFRARGGGDVSLGCMGDDHLLFIRRSVSVLRIIAEPFLCI